MVSNTSSLITEPTQALRTFQQYRTGATTIQVTRAIRDVVYPKKKFISNYNEDLCFSTDPHSICFLILEYLQRNPAADSTINREFWQAHKKLVPKTLNQKRSTVIFAIQKKFKGKKLRFVLLLIYSSIIHIHVYHNLCAHITVVSLSQYTSD